MSTIKYKILNQFIEAFGEVTYIDSVLKKIKGRGYKYYYNSILNGIKSSFF